MKKRMIKLKKLRWRALVKGILVAEEGRAE